MIGLFADRRRAARRGNVLVQFAVLLFALLPLVALVVHGGLLLSTRRQMQTAVNSAAREGLRFRDELPDTRTLVAALHDAGNGLDWDDRGAVLDRLRSESGCDESDDACLRDYLRRRLAARAVDLTFDATLDVHDSDSIALGAGPQIEFDPDSGQPLQGTEFVASRRIAAVGVYRPELALNRDNHPHGDIVAGGYQPADAQHAEQADYSRSDFDPEAADPDAVLVRLRRTDETLDTPADAATAGPPIPYLFGRGANTATVHPDDPAALWNQRERGSVVRAAAIAAARPAMTVGLPGESVDLGLAPFWLQRAAWEAAAMNVQLEVTLHSDGSLSGDLAGAFIQREGAVVLGASLAELGSLPADTESQRERYAAIYDDIQGTNRVVGFGTVRLDDGPTGTTLIKLPSRVAAVNASAALLVPLPAMPAEDLEQVFAAFRELSSSAVANNAPLLAPALQRAVR